MWINAKYVTKEMNNKNCFILPLILYVRMQISYLFYILIIYLIIYLIYTLKQYIPYMSRLLMAKIPWNYGLIGYVALKNFRYVIISINRVGISWSYSLQIDCFLATKCTFLDCFVNMNLRPFKYLFFLCQLA